MYRSLPEKSWDVSSKVEKDIKGFGGWWKSSFD